MKDMQISNSGHDLNLYGDMILTQHQEMADGIRHIFVVFDKTESNGAGGSGNANRFEDSISSNGGNRIQRQVDALNTPPNRTVNAFVGNDQGVTARPKVNHQAQEERRGEGDYKCG